MIPERAEHQSPGRRRSIVRRVTVGSKFTEAEARSLAKLAAGRGQLLAEWARESLLTAAQGQQRTNEGNSLFVEVQALRLLLVNTLEPLLRGEKMSPEQFKSMLQYVKTNKRKAAADMLASYEDGGKD